VEALMAGHGAERVDVLPKLLIVGVLCAAMIGIHAFGKAHGDFNPTAMLAVGFVVLASYTIGEIAGVVRLPHVTGYLLAGLALGESSARALAGLAPGWILPPFDAGVLNHEVLGQLKLLDTLALALICLTAGGELRVDALRAGFTRFAAIIAGQSALVLVGVTGLFVAISGPLDLIAYPKFAGLDPGAAVAVGAVLGMVSLATAIAPTVAVINSTGSKGPLTSNVLTVAVLMDIVVVLGYSAAVTVALGFFPANAGSGGFGIAAVNIGGSLVIGALAGFVLDRYLRYVGWEILLFITAMVFATAEAATAWSFWLDPNGHPELAMVFIAAGFTTANFSTRGDELVHEVERMSLPVYVIFFSMAGAKLHLDDLVAVLPYALALVGLRMALLWVGVRAGATLAGADAATRKYGWMGMVPQAGLALTLCGAVRVAFPGPLGEGLFTLILAGIALNETIGPVLLQYALGKAGETAATRALAGAAEPSSAGPTETVARLAPWRRRDADPDAWGPSPSTHSPLLNDIAVDLELELRQLVRDLERGPLTRMEEEAREHLRALRRDFLRFHRHLHASVGQQGNGIEFVHYLRSETGDLTTRWRDHLLTRREALGQGRWSPSALQEAIDQRVGGLPDVVFAPLESESLVPRDEDTWRSLRRRLLRFRTRLSTVQRQVLVRDLARFHFQGHVAGRMEGLAALVVNAELHLASRAAAVFDTIDTSADALADQARKSAAPEHLIALIDAMRVEVEAEFTLALSELDWISKDAHQRATHVIGHALRAFKDDLLTFDTPDLPARSRRFALVFQERTRGLRALSTGLQDAWRTAGSRYAALALAFEVVGLEGRVKEAVDEHTDRIARQVRGKGLTQVDRVLEAMRELLAAVEALLDIDDTPGTELAERITDAVEPAERVLDEAIDAASALRDWLASETSDEPLLDAILAAAQALTERYEVPAGVPVTGEWALPTPVPTAEIPFREVAISFIEAHVTRDLIEITRRLSVQVDGLVHGLQDLHRVVGFNAELARAELDVHAGPVGDDTRDLVREMLLGAWRRSAHRLELAAGEAAPWPEEARQQVRDAVLTKLDAFREQVFDGRITDLRHTLLREVQVRRRLLAEAGNWSAAVGTAGERISEGFAIALGDERIAAIRHSLGLPEDVQVADPAAFAEPPSLARMPTVYRRLFSDHALEAGDLLTGREAEYAASLQALRPEGPGVFRSVALVGLDPIGKRALANALIRGLGAARVDRRSPRAAVTADEIDAWFGEEAGDVAVIDGFEHLFVTRPGGFAPLKRFVSGVVADAGQTALIALFDPPVWHAAKRAVGLDSVFAQVVHLHALSPDELQTALLARHGMSGYELKIDATADLAWQLQELIARGDDQVQRNQRAWFRTLHAASGGLLHDALRLWMSSILDIDEAHGEVHLGPSPVPPVSRLRRLPQDTLLTLRQALCQGWTSPDLHASVFRVTPREAQAHLAALAHAGLLTSEDGRYVVTSHLRAPLVGVLTARGWFS
jgi:Kef-type K+ transport system membrane component KefB